MTKPLTLLCAMFIAVFLLLPVAASAQTGSFDITLPFAGVSRTVACYVPPGYDSTKAYGLVVGLHGSGHNGTDYRNVLIGSASWPSLFPNTIFMFPDGGEDQVSDFYAPVGDENFIGSTIAYARSKYSIDSSNVVLQGFSLGGRSALKYGSKYPRLFKGLLLNTPAIQGLADLENDPALAPAFNYDGAATVPVFVTVGLADPVYIDAIRLMVKKLRSRNGAVQHVEIASMGHTIPQNNVTSTAKTFFTTKTQTAYDVVLFDVYAPKFTTSTDVLAQASIQNLGASDITTLDVTFDIGGKTEVVRWTGSLASNQTAVVDTVITNAPTGAQTLRVTVQNPTSGEADPDAANNLRTYYTQVRGERGTTDVNEGFESGSRWNIDTSGNLFAWSYDDEVHKSGSYSLFAFNTILVFYTLGLSESVTSPFIDMSGLANKSFAFDYTYNYHRYTEAVLGSNRDFADTLVIEASTNSGATYTTLFRKAGAALATFDTPIMNPTAIGQCFVTPGVDDWRHANISLNDFADEQNLLVRMRYISGLGGFINIDNLTVGAEPVSVEDENITAGTSNDIISVSPNPASDNITFNFTNHSSLAGKAGSEAHGISALGITDIRLYNSAGEEVLHYIADAATETAISVNVAVASLPAGMYSATITSGTQTYVRSVAIVR